MSSQAFRLGGRPIPLLKGAVGAAVALAALSLSPGSAQAACDPASPANTCRVMVGGLQYDVTTFTGDYNSNSSSFETPANGGAMPWWNSDADTSAFIAASGTSEANLYANLGVNSGTNIIYFAYQYIPGSNAFFPPIPPGLRAKSWNDQPPGFNLGVGLSDTSAQGLTISWAQATLYTAPPSTSAPAPGPLPLFGAGAAFGFSRRLRKRIQGSRLPIGSSQPRA
jgi:hypothetical protein